MGDTLLDPMAPFDGPFWDIAPWVLVTFLAVFCLMGLAYYTQEFFRKRDEDEVTEETT